MALATLSIDLVAKLANFERDMGLAVRVAEKNSLQISKAFGNIKTTLVGLGALASTGFLTGFVKSSIDAQDALNDMSERVGIAVEELSKLKYAAQLSDLDIGTLQQGLGKLSKAMVDASNGTGQARNAFSAMGVSVKNTDGSLKSNYELLNELADGFASYEDGAKKSALAIEIFGKSGAELIPLLNQGSQGLKEMGNELALLGGVVTTEAAKNAGLFNDNLDRLAVVGGSAGKAIANQIIPYINQLATEFMVARANGLGFMDMLSMGLRSTDYENQLRQINDEINMVNKAWAFPIGPTRDERLASLEKQKKAVIDLQTILMKDQVFGPEKPKTPKDSAPISLDLDKAAKDSENYAKGLGRARDANDKFIASMQAMAAKDQLNIDSAFMTDPQKKLAEDMIAINKDFLDTQAEVTKQYVESRLKLKDYNEQAAILAGSYEYAIEVANQAKEAQDQLNNSWEYGAAKALNAYGNDVMNISKQVGSAFNQVAKGMEDSIVQFVMTGTSSFSNLANSMIADMVRIMVQQKITGPLAQAGASFFSGLFSSGSGMNASLPQGGGTFSSPAFQITQAKGGAWLDGIQEFAKGGSFSNSVVSSPTLFKFAKGTGLMGEAGPEAIMPLRRNSRGELGISGSGGGVNIVINNQAAPDGYEAVASAKQNDAGMNIEVMVRKAVSSDLSANGPMAQQMSNVFGLRRSI